MFSDFKTDFTKQNEKAFNTNLSEIQAEIVDLNGLDVLGEDGLHLTLEGHKKVA